MSETAQVSFKKSLDYMGFQPGESLLGKKIDYVFLGACTNGRIEDFRAFASIVKGRKKAENVIAWLVPGSWRCADSEGRNRQDIDGSWFCNPPTGMFCLSGDE